jgi:hypothetical protein
MKQETPTKVTAAQTGRRDTLEDAIALHEQNLPDLGRVLGPNHPSTLGSSNSLAMTYLSAGRVHDAISLLEQTLAEVERVLGRGDPEADRVRNNLANARQQA